MLNNLFSLRRRTAPAQPVNSPLHPHSAEGGPLAVERDHPRHPTDGNFLLHPAWRAARLARRHRRERQKRRSAPMIRGSRKGVDSCAAFRLPRYYRRAPSGAFSGGSRARCAARVYSFFVGYSLSGIKKTLFYIILL